MGLWSEKKSEIIRRRMCRAYKTDFLKHSDLMHG